MSTHKVSYEGVTVSLFVALMLEEKMCLVKRPMNEFTAFWRVRKRFLAYMYIFFYISENLLSVVSITQQV